MEYRVIIAGGRDFQNYDLVRQKCDYYLQNRLKTDKVIIVSGHARGADSLGEQYAQERGLNCEQFPADWKTFGKAAGYRRNGQMAEVAQALIAFWDGQSRGTKNIIDIAKSKKLKTVIVDY